MSIGFESEFPSTLITAKLPGATGAGMLKYNVLKGLPLFRTKNHRIAGVIEYAGRGGPSLLEIVTAPDENPYEVRGDGYLAQIKNVVLIAEAIAKLEKKGWPLSEALEKVNDKLDTPWQLVEESGLARYSKIKASHEAGALLPTLKGRKGKTTAIGPKELAIALSETLCLTPGAAGANVQISFSTTLAKLGTLIEKGRCPFADLVKWCKGEEKGPEFVALKMLAALPVEDKPPPDVLGFLYLVFHRLAAEMVQKKHTMVGKNRFVALPRFNLRQARKHLGQKSREYLAGLVEKNAQEEQFYLAILTAAERGLKTTAKLTLGSQLSTFLSDEHGDKVKQLNMFGTFLYAVFEDKASTRSTAQPTNNPSALAPIDELVVDVEDTTHCPVFLRGWPNLVFELRIEPEQSSLENKLLEGAKAVLAYDDEPKLEPKFVAGRQPRDPKAKLRCDACGGRHGNVPSSPWGNWHICKTCHFVYCNVCGFLLKASSVQTGIVRTTRACDECSGDTALVMW
jgi:hypothetical protein